MASPKLKNIIVVDKPIGITSMTVVRVLRKILKPLNIKTIGYAGTLDPRATGVLVVGIGKEGTKQLGNLSDKDKEYICKIDLLKDTPSGDLEGFKQDYQKSLSDLPEDFNIPSLNKISTLIQEKFIGDVKQIPPVTSAIKINGKKACDLARKGIEVKMKERIIKIYKIDIISYEFPILELRVKCSKGTYIRTLGQDIGKALDLWGSLIYLRRVVSGDHTLDDAMDLNKITLDDLIC